jgi:hypothetical protein
LRVLRTRAVVAVLQLPSRLEVLTRLRQEKAEAAALKQDPLGTTVDAKSESLARLQALRQQQQPGAAGTTQQQQDADVAEDGPSPSGRDAAAGADGGVTAAADGSGSDGDAAAAVGEGEPAGDPCAGMNPRQRKLYELKQKMQQARKANENAIIAERKRMRVSGWPLAVLLCRDNVTGWHAQAVCG